MIIASCGDDENNSPVDNTGGNGRNGGGSVSDADGTLTFTVSGYVNDTYTAPIYVTEFQEVYIPIAFVPDENGDPFGSGIELEISIYKYKTVGIYGMDD